MTSERIEGIFELITGLIGWILLFIILDWKVGVALIFILWSNNLMIHRRYKEG